MEFSGETPWQMRMSDNFQFPRTARVSESKKDLLVVQLGPEKSPPDGKEKVNMEVFRCILKCLFWSFNKLLAAKKRVWSICLKSDGRKVFGVRAVGAMVTTF